MGACLSSPTVVDSFYLHELKEAGVDPGVILDSRSSLTAALEATPGLVLATVSRGGETLLHLAAARGKTFAVRQLLAAGADPDARDNQGRTPLHRAAATGKEASLKALLLGGAQMEARTMGAGHTALHLAAIAANEACLEALVALGADVECRDLVYGWTALQWAAWNGQLPSISFLGADGRANLHVRARNTRNGATATDLAAKHDMWEAVCLLRQLGAPPLAAKYQAPKPRAAPTAGHAFGLMF